MNEVFLAVLLACIWTDSEADSYAACPVLLTVERSFETLEQCATVGADAVVERLMESPEALHGKANRYFDPGDYQMVVDCRSQPAWQLRYARRYAL